MRIIGIDPGPATSGWVEINTAGQVVAATEYANDDVCRKLFEYNPGDLIAIEDFTPYGKSLGQESMATIKWVGEFRQFCKHDGLHYIEIPRPEVKLHHCDCRTAKDSDVRDAMIHRYGPGKDCAIGLKKSPGPLYGIKTHLWPALAVALVALDRYHKETH